MTDTFRSDIIKKDQLVHLVDRICLKEQTGYVLRMRPESKSYQRAIEHYHGFNSTDVEINKTRHPIKRIIEIIIHFYVKIIAISMQTVIENLYSLSPERKFAEKNRLDDQEPFEYLDVNGFEHYYVLMMNRLIDTQFILKTICEAMLNKPSSKPIKDILINLYKRQPETKPLSLELSDLWMKFVEHVLECYDEIVLENDPKASQKKKTGRQSPSVFDEAFSNLVWTNILSSLEEIETFTLQFRNRMSP